ncbi:Putative endo-beta-N-acetylglucosaminidase precursor [Gemella morbillorum]|uniref:CHAP domain-containing protein n=2 Tax=Gemella morbillorum TaxID=29391 RepID=UPI000DA3F674|nr:CHAP domain-containing protein [Gemella morbillorum]UBH80925.1 CHAP domain-containing protein [Gemella morbillorum]SQH54678.1 Putative endo-beta-N-acetylglucosaminidase precursor [Gemella morbillorum]
MRSNLKLGLGFLTVLATPFVVGEVSGNEAQAAQGWVQNGSAWYHYKDNGSLTKNAWVGNYWLGADGRMITNSWVDNNNYYVGHDGLWVKNVKKTGWIQSGSSWYYYNNQGQMERNAWVGDYWVGADGRMATSSWVDNNNYYVGSNGVWVRNAKKTGWIQNGSTWYHYNSQGQMEKNKWIGDYWVGSDGKMATNSWVDNNNYYVGADGLWVKDAQRPGWAKKSGAWYHYDNKGNLTKNAWVGNYWLGSDGKMATNSWVDNNNYYVGANGAWEKDAKKAEEKKSGWVSNEGVWYYYDDKGKIVKNSWQGDYYLGSDGKMIVRSWIYDDTYKAWYYLGENGVYKRNTWIGDYWVGANGKMATNSWIYDNAYKAWYYLGENGVYKRNTWVGDYWVGSNGKMATNSWVDNGRYYVGPSGAWEKNAGKSATGRASLDSVLNIARNYLGVQSGSEEHKKIVDAYNSVNPKPVGYTAKYSDDWCDIFVTTVFQQAGLSHLIGRECGVQRHIGILEQKGIWKGKTQPKVGDIVTFDWDGGGWADHIGIVESVNNGVITTIEGNSAQYAGDTAPTKVNRKTYNWDSRYIKGYARPMY